MARFFASLLSCMVGSVVCVGLLTPFSAYAQQEICGSPPSFDVKKEEADAIKGDLNGKAQALSKLVGNAELAGRIEKERKTIYQTSEGSEGNRKDAYLAYVFCVIIMQDKNASMVDKLNALQNFRQPPPAPHSEVTPKDTWSVEVGGPGGSTFGPITCRGGQALIGLFGKAIGQNIGPFIFSVGPVCAPAQFNSGYRITTLSANALRKGDTAGSDQGDPFELMCPLGTVVIGFEMESAALRMNDGNNHEYLVAPLTLRCSSVLSSADPASIKTVTGVGKHLPIASGKAFYCPDGTAAYGINGRAGQFVDALSVGCRPYG